MRLGQSSSRIGFNRRSSVRRSVNRGRAIQSRAVNAVIDALEPRQLFASGPETVTTPISPVLASVANPAANAITLNQHFFDATLPGTLVTFTTSLGTIDVGLTDAATPNTVANFLSYVNSGAYTNSIFHRSVNIATNQGGSPEAPASIIQGGGYAIDSTNSLSHIATNAPIADEYAHELYGDIAGTIAMAKTSQANSATSEWYFNVSDNTELDPPTTDSNGATTSYTVFGQVLGSGSLSVIDQISKLPVYGINSTLTDVPVTGLTEAQIAAGAQVNGNNLIYTEKVVSQAGTSYNVSSDNKALVTPSVSNGVLSFTYGTGSGTAQITVVASNLDGTSATTTFSVTVPNSATPNAGPTAADFTAPFVITGNTGTFSALSQSTDSLAALDPTKVAIVTQPAHGTATLDTATGNISYTPTGGYTGADSLTYTVTDTNGSTSAPATITLSSVPTAVTVDVGAGAASSLTFTQPDGITGKLRVFGGTATVTFTDYRVTTTTSHGAIVATGAGARITSIVVTNSTTGPASIMARSKGPITLGSVSDPTGYMYIIDAPTATLTGNCTFLAIAEIKAAAVVNAKLDLGLPYTTGLLVPIVTNTNVIGNHIGDIISKQWTVTDGGSYSVNASNVALMTVTGTFANSLILSEKNYSIFRAKVGSPTAPWQLAGSLFQADMKTPGTGWTLTSNGLVGKLSIKGNLANNITAAAITSLTVSGTTTNTVIQTDAAYSAKFQQIGKLAFAGAVSSTVIFSAGNIGSITAASLKDSRIYAGVNLSVAQNGALASATTDLAANASIGSITLSRGTTTFSNVLISADILGAMKLGRIASANAGTAQGISAHTIKSIAAVLVPGGTIKAAAPQLKSAATLDAYEKASKLALGDFKITLF